MEKNEELYLTIHGASYRPIGVLGEGGQGTVYEATAETDPSRRFVIKKFHSKDYVMEFLESEKLAQTVAEYSHQTLFAATAVDQNRQIALSLKAPSGSRTIEKIIEDWEIEPPQSANPRYKDMGKLIHALDIVKSILGALDAWHSAGVLHLDVCAKNVLWCEAKDRGVAYLLDMSSCKKIGFQPIHGIWSNNGYAAPELFDGVQLTPAADIYSVGSLLFYLCGGKTVLFNETLPDLPGFLNGNVEDLLSRLAIYPGCKHQLRELLIRATNRLDDHYESAEEMMEDIQKLQETISGSGVSRYVLLNGSANYFQKHFSQIYPFGVNQDLLPEIEGTMGRHTILLGEGGSGKSTLIYENFRRHLDDVTHDFTAPLPLYIPLAAFDPTKENWSTYITDYILSNYCNLGADEENRQKLYTILGSGRYKVYLDGINESLSSFRLGEQIAKLVNYSNVEICIASRHADFDWPCLAHFETAKTQPLSDERIHRILDKISMSASGRLIGVLRNPMMLSLYLTITTGRENIQSAGEILLTYHQRLVNEYKQGYHRQEDQEFYEQIILNILPKAAYTLGKIHFSGNEFTAALDGMGINSRKTLDALCSSGLIRKTEGMTIFQDAYYQFSHQNILEWNIARYVQLSMEAADEDNLPNCLSKQFLSDLILDFLGDLLGEHKAEGSSKIEAWLQDHTATLSSEEARMVNRNLIEAMKRARSGNLSANFSELDLSLVNFYDCAVKADFTEATVADSSFLRPGHKKQIDAMLFLPEKNWIATASRREKRICFWDTTTGREMWHLDCKSPVTSMILSENQKKLVIHHRWAEITVVDMDTLISEHKQMMGNENSFNIHSERHIEVRFYDNDSILCNTDYNSEGHLLLWNLDQGTSERLIDLRKGFEKFPEAEIVDYCYLPNKNRLFCLSSEGELVTWNLKRRCTAGESLLIRKKHTDSMYVTPDGKWASLWAWENRAFQIVNLKTGEVTLLDSMYGCDHVKPEIAATGNFFVFGTDKGLMVYDTRTNTQTLYHTPPVTALTISEAQIAFADKWCNVRIGSTTDAQVSHRFNCGYENENPVPTEVHWFDHGLVKKDRRDHVLVMTKKGVRKLPMERCFQSFLDGNFCIWLQAKDDGRHTLHVSDLRTGEAIVTAPWTPECTATNTSGDVVFSERCDLKWARYYLTQGKIVICYSIGLVKIYDIARNDWLELPSWSQEITQLIQCIPIPFIVKRTLPDITNRSAAAENCVLIGTSNGHIQFWDLDGVCQKDYAAHDQITSIAPIDDTGYWISEGKDGSRCVWNAQTMQLIDRSFEHCYNGWDEIDDLLLYKECFEDFEFISEIEIGSWEYQKKVIHTTSQMMALQNGDHGIRIYDLRNRKYCGIVDLTFTRPDSLFEQVFLSCDINFVFREDGRQLAVGFPDGSVRVYDTNGAMLYDWISTDTLDISGSIFDGTRMSENLAKILHQNEAIVKNPDTNSK